VIFVVRKPDGYLKKKIISEEELRRHLELKPREELTIEHLDQVLMK
jgi:SOS response regulatory protein OraA/RecX